MSMRTGLINDDFKVEVPASEYDKYRVYSDENSYIIMSKSELNSAVKNQDCNTCLKNSICRKVSCRGYEKTKVVKISQI